MNPSAIPFTSRLTSSHPPRPFDTRRPSLEDTSHIDEWRSPHIRTSHSSSPHRHATPPMPHLSPSSSDKIHALLAVINDLDNLGVEHKFIDSLHIAYRQMFPQLQITGRSLFDIASQAEQLGLITISGDEPHRQIQLTTKGAHLYHSKNMRPPSSSYSRRGSNASTSSYVTTPTEPDLFPNLHESSLESLLQSADAQLEGMERFPTYDDIPMPVVSNQDYVEHQRRQSQVTSTSSVPPISVGGFTNPNNTGVASPLTTSSMVGTNGLPLFNPAPGVFFDAGSLEDKLFRGEKPRHLKYMFGFRVNPCHDFLNNKCPAESKTRSSTQCFDYHAPKTKRRVARIYQYSNGIFFNYNACRCQAMEKDEKCDRGDACRYAHCKEEIAYHPSRYKTQQCSYPARSDGVCTRFGAHCAFAHGEDDMRKPLILKQGMPHKLIDGSDGAPVALQARTAPTGLESDDGPTDRPLRLDDFICSPEEMPAERHFYMYVYKTKPCSEPTMDCARGICPNYHYANKRRRNPKLYAYTYEPCPNVKSPDSGQWRQPSACEKGDACPYAHTLLESMYHPDVYKTVLCSNFDEHDPSNWKCQWGRHCAHAHSQAELEYNENHTNDEVARTPTTEILGGKRGSVVRTSFSGFLPASAASASTPTRPSPVNVASSPSHAMLSTHLRAGSPSLTQSLTISMPNTPVNQPRPSPFPRSPIGQTRTLGLGLPSTAAATATSGSISPSPSPSLPTGSLFPSHAPSLGPDLLRIDTPTERATPSEMRRSSVPTPSDVLRPRGFTYASQSTPSSPHLTPRTWNKPPHPLSITRGREDEEEKNKDNAMEQENVMLKRKIATMTEELEQHQRHQHQSSLEISSLQQRLAEMDRHLQGDISMHELIQSLRTQLAHVQEQHQGVQWECMQLRDAKQKQDITHAEVMRTLAKQQEEKNAMEIHYTGLQEEMSRMKIELTNITAQRDEAMNKLAETPSSHSRTSSLMSQQMWDRSVITLTPEEWDTIQQRIYKMSSLLIQHDLNILHDIMKQAHNRLFHPSFPSLTDVSLSTFIIESIIHMDEITNDVTLHARIKGGNEEVVLHMKCPAQEGGFSIPAFHTSIPPHPHLLPILTHFSDNIDDDKLGLATLNTSSSPHMMHALQSLVNHHSRADIMVTAPYITSLSHVTHRWNIREITYLAIQLCSAVCHMHQHQVVHGGITADEIMVMTRIMPETTSSPSYPSINMTTSSSVSSPSLSSRTISMPNSITSSPIVSPRYLDFAKMVQRRPSLHPMITADRIMDGIQQDVKILLSLTHAACIDITKGSMGTTTSTTSTLIAPEWARAIRDHRDQMDYFGVDAWAVGMVLYQLVTGTSHAFRVDDITSCTDADYISPSEVSSAITASSPSLTSMEITLHRIIASLLHIDPSQRLTLTQARTQLEHEYWSHHHTHVQQRTSNAPETIPALSLDIAMRVMDVDVKEKNVNVNIDRLRVEDGLLLDTLVSQRLVQVDDA